MKAFPSSDVKQKTNKKMQSTAYRYINISGPFYKGLLGLL